MNTLNSVTLYGRDTDTNIVSYTIYINLTSDPYKVESISESSTVVINKVEKIIPDYDLDVLKQYIADKVQHLKDNGFATLEEIGAANNEYIDIDHHATMSTVARLRVIDNMIHSITGGIAFEDLYKWFGKYIEDEHVDWYIWIFDYENAKVICDILPEPYVESEDYDEYVRSIGLNVHVTRYIVTRDNAIYGNAYINTSYLKQS